MSSTAGPKDRAAQAPLVSVAIPVYNGADHVGEAIASVLDQDYENVEIIVRDNASDDATEAICRRFADTDPRVRYLRNAVNIGLLPNFSRARDDARGTYFGWLSHDDVLSDRRYLSAVVQHLEDHPDVVACQSAMRIVDSSTGDARVVELPELAAGRRWEDARRDLFRWPPDWLELMSHAIFRLAALAPFEIRERSATGRPNVFRWEIDMLTTLAQRGRLVVIGPPLRTYRSSEGSTARRMGRTVSPFDLRVLSAETKTTLLLRALRTDGPLLDRLRLVLTAIGNLPKPTFRRRFDHRHASRLLERELAMLRRTADERSALIERLEQAIRTRRELLPSEGAAPNRGVDTPHSAAPSRTTVPATRPTRGRLTDLFSRPTDEQLAYLDALTENVAGLRDHCARQLARITELDGEAAALLERIERSER